MRRSLTMVLALLVAGSLLLAGCGDSDEQVESKPAGDGGEKQSQPEPPDGEPTVAGPIESIQLFEPITEGCTPPEELDPEGSRSSDDPPICTPGDVDTLGTFLIAPGTGTGEVDAASVTVSKETELLKADGSGGWEPGRFQDLIAGVEVRVWSGGKPMAQSYPVQFEAEAVAYGDSDGPPDDGSDAGGGTTGSAPPPTETAPTPPTVTAPGGTALPAEPPTSAGTVTAVEPCPEFNPNTPGTCADQLISTVQVDTTGGQGPALAARLTSRTTILIFDGTAWSNGSVNDVQPGTTVRVWVEADRLTKSIPAQGDAATIAVGPTDR